MFRKRERRVSSATVQIQSVKQAAKPAKNRSEIYTVAAALPHTRLQRCLWALCGASLCRSCASHDGAKTVRSSRSVASGAQIACAVSCTRAQPVQLPEDSASTATVVLQPRCTAPRQPSWSLQALGMRRINTLPPAGATLQALVAVPLVHGTPLWSCLRDARGDGKQWNHAWRIPASAHSRCESPAAMAANRRG